MTAIQNELKPLVVTRKNAAALLEAAVDKIDPLIAEGQLETVKLGVRRVGVKMRAHRASCRTWAWRPHEQCPPQM